MKPASLHIRACRLLDVDGQKVRLVGPTEWRQITGHGAGNCLGRSDRKHNLIYVRRRQGLDTYIHELLHILFPSRPHWWVFGAAFKLAGVSTGQYAYGRWQDRETITESKAKLLRLAQAAAIRCGLGPEERR